MVTSFPARTPWNMEGYIFLQDRNRMKYSEICLETLTEIALIQKKCFISLLLEFQQSRLCV